MVELMGFSPLTRRILDANAEIVFGRVLEALGDKAEGKTGGTLRIRYARDPDAGLRGWHEIYMRHVGRREGDYWETTDDFSQEKAHRLMKRYAHDRHHVSSFQGCNPANWEFSGAFITRANIPDLGGPVLTLVSFSGLPDKAHGDETFGLLLVDAMGWFVRDGSAPMLVTVYSKNILADKLLSF